MALWLEEIARILFHCIEYCVWLVKVQGNLLALMRLYRILEIPLRRRWYNND